MDTGMERTLLVVFPLLALSACATIVSDPYIPLAISFSDRSEGNCEFKNERGKWTSEIPTTNEMLRRSDDALIYDCETENCDTAKGSIRSEIEGKKLAASVVLGDLGIADAITDKHRTYQAIS